jgi:hypothetical protein
MKAAKTDYAGIDYSLGQANRNQETGIHYGVIHHREVGQYWYDESEPHYSDECECEEQFDFGCECDPISLHIEEDDISAEQPYDDPDIFVLKSKYYTWAQYCSPCAPGAGYLMNFTDPGIGIKAYCFGHDWFENEKAPYPVYDVKTNGLV